MNQRTRKRIVQTLEYLARRSVDVSAEGHKLNLTIGMGPSAYRLLDEDAEEYVKLVKAMLANDDWGLKFSELTVSFEVNRIIGILRSSVSRAAAQHLLDEVGQKMDAYDTVNRAYVPLAGIETDFLPVEIGNVTLMVVARPEAEKPIVSAFSTIESHGGTQPEIERANAYWENRISNDLEGKVCAVFEAVAEPDRIIERAEDEGRRAVDLLMFAASALYSPSLVGIALEGELLSSTRRTFVSGPAEESEITSAGRRVGSIAKFSFAPDHMEVMRRMGIFTLSQIVRSQSPSNLEEALLRAIHWFATSQQQRELAHQLLSLVTCLETLLAPEVGGQISTTIAENAAFLLARDFEVRRGLKDFIKRMYDGRSRISHGGSKPVLENEIDELRIICGGILVEVTRLVEEDREKNVPELPDTKALRYLIDDKRLGKSAPPMLWYETNGSVVTSSHN
jgi:Apea-like HEPN